MRGEISYLGLHVDCIKAEYGFYQDTKKNGKPSTEILFSGFEFTMASNPAGIHFLEQFLKVDKQFRDPNQANPTPSEVFKPLHQKCMTLLVIL